MLETTLCYEILGEGGFKLFRGQVQEVMMLEQDKVKSKTDKFRGQTSGGALIFLGVYRLEIGTPIRHVPSYFDDNFCVDLTSSVSFIFTRSWAISASRDSQSKLVCASVGQTWVLFISSAELRFDQGRRLLTRSHLCSIYGDLACIFRTSSPSEDSNQFHFPFPSIRRAARLCTRRIGSRISRRLGWSRRHIW
jgi:hypothetical protein